MSCTVFDTISCICVHAYVVQPLWGLRARGKFHDYCTRADA
jgi:hypothetical protein